MLPPLKSRVAALPLEFELSPIIKQDIDQQEIKLHHRRNKLIRPNNFNTSLAIKYLEEEGDTTVFPSVEEATTSSGFGNIPENSREELSTWIGGK